MTQQIRYAFNANVRAAPSAEKPTSMESRDYTSHQLSDQVIRKAPGIAQVSRKPVSFLERTISRVPLASVYRPSLPAPKQTLPSREGDLAETEPVTYRIQCFKA